MEATAIPFTAVRLSLPRRFRRGQEGRSLMTKRCLQKTIYR